MRQHFTWTICSCALLIWAGTQSWAFQDGDTPAVGLTGIMATYAPDGLTEDDFNQLSEEIDETWKSWVLETGALVKDFYEGEHDTVESQREAIQKLRVKLRTIEKALADRRYRSIHDEISDLYLKLSPRVDLAEGLLDTLTIDESKAEQIRFAPAKEALDGALIGFRNDMNSVRGGRPWLQWANVSALSSFDPASEASLEAVNTIKGKLEKRESFSDEIKTFMSRESFLALEDALSGIQKTAATPVEDNSGKLRELAINLLDTIADYNDEPTSELEAQIRAQFSGLGEVALDGGVTLNKVFNKHYENYNLRVSVSEGMLNRIAGDVRRETSRINDAAMGARIVGSQTSQVTVGVDIQPSNNSARFNVKLTGTVSTSSNAYTSEATIRTVGRHSVSAVKPVTFDGTEFKTSPARVSVRSNNQPVGASTAYSGRLFGRIAENIAMNEANDRRGQANAYSQRKISNEVSAGLNEEVDTRFANASMELQNRLYGPLREYGLYPDAMSYTSTESEINVRTRLSNGNELGGGQGLPGLLPPQNGLIVQVHQSLLTNGSNRLDLGTEGKQKMTEGELRSLIEERLSKILDREVKLGDEGAEEAGNTFVFDQPNPIRFAINNGEVVVILRAGLEREGDNIPTQIITIPLIPSMSDGKVMLSRGNVGVKPVERPSSVAEQVARANVMRQNIQKALPEREFDATYEIEQDGKKVTVSITSINADNGWLTLTLE